MFEKIEKALDFRGLFMSCLICCAQAQAEGRQALPGVAARHRYLHRFSASYDIMAQWTSEILSLLLSDAV
ncbi:hypothetical protein N9P31_00020 [bacterium]|nr:hypothetical protein [bacterium]